MVILGGLALLLFSVLLGTFWPHRQVHVIEISVWGYIVKSLFLTWFVFLVSFLTPAGKFAPLFVCVLTASALVMLSRRRCSVLSPEKMTRYIVDTRQWVFFIALAALLMKIVNTHDPIFALWDAVVSWNRWASELYRNTYHPINAAYPFLWPALWSLIYESQQSAAIWYFAKASIAIPVIGLALLSAGQIRTAQAISGVIFCGMVYSILFYKSDYLTSGYMDLTIAVVGLASLILLIEIVEQKEPARRRELVYFAALTLSVALVTKQSAMLFCVAFLFCFVPIVYRREMGVGDIVAIIAILCTPIATYLQIYSVYGTSIFGHLSMLESFVDDTRGNLSAYGNAWRLLAEIAPSPAAIIMWGGVLLNISNFKRPVGMLGLGFLILAGAGFAIYANCCSYDWRNGVWIYSFLIASAHCGFKATECVLDKPWSVRPKLRVVRMPPLFVPVLIGIAITLLCAFQLTYPNAKLMSQHDSLREKIVGVREWNNWFVRFKDVFVAHDRVVSFYQPFGYIPYTEEKYVRCDLINHACIARQFENFDVNSVLAFTFGAESDDAQAKQFINRTMQTGASVTAVKENNHHLITFRRDGWAAYLKTIQSEQ